MNIERLNSQTAAPRGFLFLLFAVVWFGLSPAIWAADGGLRNQNTAEGNGALSSLTTGANNTAVGFRALFSLSTGFENTATGSLALANDNGTGYGNTAYGFSTLTSNTTGRQNVATGRNALLSNTEGNFNTATGDAALLNNTTGDGNTATGFYSLFYNTTAEQNTGHGVGTLYYNTTGERNTADGFEALFNNTTGHDNIGLGFLAGQNLTTGNNNIDIGAYGRAGESNHIRIGEKGVQKNTYIAGISGTTIANGVAVVINPDGHLGTVTSSSRFKDGVKPMDKSSEAIFGLKPVTFHYKSDLDPNSIPQFGLIAEQVAKVNPDLVARDDQGKVYTVRYEAVNAMLLNEFLKEHRKVEEQTATLAKQEKEITALAASLKEQASQIRKVSDQLAVSNAPLQVALSNR